MANRKKEVYKPRPMTEGKRNLIQGLLQEYDIETAEDIQDALKDPLSGTVKEMLEAEMDDHLGYGKYERSGEANYRNGTKPKRVRSKYGEFEVDVPQDRPLAEVYPIVFIDAVHFSVRDDGIIRKLAAYVVLGINVDGRKEVLAITIGENESGKYWLGVLNGLKNRGVRDILILCSDGLGGIKEAISAAFPATSSSGGGSSCHTA